MTFEIIERTLALHRPRTLAESEGVPAAVSLVLAPDAGGLQVLFIERATHADDPWSGNVGFPGGKMETEDADLQQTAVRETREEVGIDLHKARYLGRLSDVGGPRLRVRVSCFVYGLDKIADLRCSNEVKDAFWVPLEALLDPARHGEAAVKFDDRSFTRPSFKLPQDGKPPLWGLTYRLIRQFLEILPARHPQDGPA